MKKILLWGALWSIGALAAMAQGTPTDSIKTQIKQIKLSEKYVYAEAAGTSTLEEVRTLAVEELYIHIAEYLSAEGKTKEDIASINKRAEQEHLELAYHNGTLHKAFAYVSKGFLAGEATASAPPATAEVPTVKEEAPAPTETPKTAVPTEPVVPAAGKPDEPKPAVPPIPAETDVPATSDTVSIAIDPATPDETSYVVPQEEDPAEAVKEREEGKKVSVTIPDTHERVLKDILALDTYESVMLYLSAMKEDGRLMYGRINTLVSPEQAYLIVIKDGRLVTILNRGTGERMNLRTQQADTVRNYRGHAVIWMKIFEAKGGEL